MSDTAVTDTDTEDRPARKQSTHPICQLLRDLRTQTGMSLSAVQAHYGFSAVVLGAYERGDREPPMRKLDEALALYGYKLIAVPADENAVLPQRDVINLLRSIAAQLEARDVGLL